MSNVLITGASGFIGSFLVEEGLKRYGRTKPGYHKVLDAAEHRLPPPWSVEYFEDPENRRVLGGLGHYGWLGHVGASGQFMHLLKAGPKSKWRVIADCVNAAATLNPGHDIGSLRAILDPLVSLGPTMKVWGRLLALVRPDLYCSVSSKSLRRNLSDTLRVPQSFLATPEGYVKLIELVHSAPWFNSKRPPVAGQVRTWNRRVAFMDAIFHEG